ncbi:suppressor of forked protein [Cystoisospora suis]|uniref:Suppressor of forked protein n=1 Tax=Cystoisospora suis TaxID=483139 RepID=A0A2C6KZK7_9APIC|nr:suppressor of forked protein [Cystoisospora suis]
MMVSGAPGGGSGGVVLSSSDIGVPDSSGVCGGRRMSSPPSASAASRPSGPAKSVPSKRGSSDGERASSIRLFFIKIDGVFASPPVLSSRKGKEEPGKNVKGLAGGGSGGDSVLTVGGGDQVNHVTEQKRKTKDDEDGGNESPRSNRGENGEQVDDLKNARIAEIETKIQANPFSSELWNELLEINESSEVYERVLEYFPTSAAYWKRYAEFLYRTRSIQKAHAVYKRCTQACPHLDLWLSYLRFLYVVGSLHDFLLTLRRAVDRVGFDYRSAPVWMELLAIYVRVHNTLLLLKGHTQGLLSAPSIPGMTGGFSSTNGLSSTPLLATEIEQRSFCRPLSATSGPIAEKLTDVNVLRSAFQQCLSTAIEGLDGVWAAYCAFERSLISGNSQLIAKLTGEAQFHYNASKEAYVEIQRMGKNIDPFMLAVPIAQTTKTDQAQIEAWQALLRFEKSNPLRLQATPLLRRLTHLYQWCLLSCAFVSDIWLDLFQLLLAHNHLHKAVDVLRKAIERFLPEDELLQLVLADVLEERRMVKAAGAVYRSALALQTQLRSSVASADCSDGSVASPVMLIRYLDFVRRTHVRPAKRGEVLVVFQSFPSYGDPERVPLPGCVFGLQCDLLSSFRPLLLLLSTRGGAISTRQPSNSIEDLSAAAGGVRNPRQLAFGGRRMIGEVKSCVVAAGIRDRDSTRTDNAHLWRLISVVKLSLG